MIRIFRYLKRREWGMIAISLCFVTAQVWLDLRLPDFMNEITTLIQTPGSAMREIWVAGGKMLLCTLLSGGTSVIVGYLAAKVAAGFSQRLRALLFSRVGAFSMEEINGFSTASLITRTTNDVTQVQMLVAIGLQVIIRAPIMAVWAVTKISTKSWEWTALTGGAVLALLSMILFIMLYALPRFKKIQWLTDNLNRVMRENLTGIRVVRAYNAEWYQEQKFESANSEMTRNNLSAHRAMSVFHPGMRIVMNGLNLGIYWIGAYLIARADMVNQIGIFSNMLVFSQYAMQILMSFMMLTMIFIMAPRVTVSARRINEVLETEPKIRDGRVTETPAGKSGEVEFRNVSFKYPDAEAYVLKNVSFTAAKGETVAFIGSTGSGKSTLINLIPRFYDATEGQVLVDGIDVKDFNQKTLRNKIGYVPQRAFLFAGDVTSNVTFGDSGRGPATEEQVKKAVSIAQATEFVEEMEGGYDAPIAQGGANVSGGQRQRLAIARAISRDPEILIFDDSFSALDYRTDRTLRSALRRETEGVTSFIVAQRIGTIRDADKIIVLDEGEVVGIGTHDALMQSSSIYREIAFSQLSKEELGHA